MAKEQILINVWLFFHPFIWEKIKSCRLGFRYDGSPFIPIFYYSEKVTILEPFNLNIYKQFVCIMKQVI